MRVSALVLVGLLWVSPVLALSTLGTAAQSLAVGSWTSITPTGKATVDASLVTSFGASASYDVIRRQINYIGSVHPAPYDHILYDDISNSYLDGTLFSGVPAGTNFVGHGFDGNTSDPRTGDVFYLCRTGSCGGNYIYKKAYNATTWTALALNPLSPNEMNSDASAITYFPEMNAIIVVVPSGRVYRCNNPCTSTGNWALVGTISATGSYTFAEYNQARGFVLLGSFANNLAYTLNSAGTLAAKTYFSSNPYTGTGHNGNVVADPVSGVFIVTNGVSTGISTHTCSTYDVTPSTSPTQGSCTSPPAGMTGSTVSVALRHYGVIAYIHCGDGCGASTLNIYLYKHTASNLASNDLDVRCSHPDVTACQRFDSASDFVPAVFPGTGVYPGSGDNYTLQTRDTSVFKTGTSALRFRWPAGVTGSNPAGDFRQLFNASFSQNSHFYVQYSMRISPEFVSNMDFWNSNWKHHIMYRMLGSSCAGMEITGVIAVASSSSNAVPHLYTDCGARSMWTSSDNQSWTNGTPLWQQQTATVGTSGYSCQYNFYTVGTGNGTGCFFFAQHTNQWVTFYYDIQLGAWETPTSIFKGYVAFDGGPYLQYVNVTNMSMSFDVSASNGYTVISLLPYQTGLSTSAPVDAYMWFDDVIVSTSPIAAPGVASGGGGQDTTPPSAPTGVTVSRLVQP